MPNPPQIHGITTNIRNTKSPHWRRWLAPESRCLVPEGRLTSFMATTASKSSQQSTRAIRPIAPNLTKTSSNRGDSHARIRSSLRRYSEHCLPRSLDGHAVQQRCIGAGQAGAAETDGARSAGRAAAGAGSPGEADRADREADRGRAYGAKGHGCNHRE